jgi:hypothetical protein
MRITPSTHVLEALRSQSLGWTRAHGELIDNAIDASATTVTITNDRGEQLTIADDGIGCADMEAMFRLGDHRPHARRGLGRFGIGLKDAALWLWGTTTIRSVHHGKRYLAEVAWDALGRQPHWDVDDPIVTSAPTDPPGTTIVFSRIVQKMRSGKHYEELVHELGFLFAPALRRGVRIVFRRAGFPPLDCARFETPPLEHAIDADVDVQGRRAHVHVGVVPEGIPNIKSGLHYTHRHRVIIPSSGLGCDGASTARLFGWVALTDQWRLSKNKDDISELRDELGRAVHACIAPVLVHATQQSDSMALAGLEADLTDMLRGTVGGRREKERRDPGDDSGTVTPKGTGRPRGAVKRQPGNRLPGRIEAGRLRVEFVPLADYEGIGVVDISSNRVRLALNHPYVARLLAANARAPLFQVALSLVIHHCVAFPEDTKQMRLFRDGDGDERKFSTALARCLTEALEQEIV